MKSSSSSSDSFRSEVSKSVSYPNESDVDDCESKQDNDDDGESMDTMYDSSDFEKQPLSPASSSESSLCIDEKPKRGKIEYVISRCSAMYPNMVDEKVRFNTFKKRSWHHNQKSEELAAAGFFYSCVKFNYCFSSLINFVFNSCTIR